MKQWLGIDMKSEEQGSGSTIDPSDLFVYLELLQHDESFFASFTAFLPCRQVDSELGGCLGWVSRPGRAKKAAVLRFVSRAAFGMISGPVPSLKCSIHLCKGIFTNLTCAEGAQGPVFCEMRFLQVAKVRHICRSPDAAAMAEFHSGRLAARSVDLTSTYRPGNAASHNRPLRRGWQGVLPACSVRSGTMQ